uniref:SWIM-type zinc finger 7 associated protein 1 n=1 Tax=Amphiprion percula TaxID=161767 RepID=A0A3P8TQ66_AMPPE
MADILSLVFRTFTSPAGLKKQLPVRPPPPAAGSSLLLGDPDLSRSMLLLAAVTAASELGMRVVFFTQTQIQSLPVSLQRCFSYPRTLEELLLQVASLHESTNTCPTPPSLIIVDRLEGFLCGAGGSNHSGSHPAQLSCAAHLSALLCDTAAFLTQVLGQRGSNSGPCRFIVSFLSEVDTGQGSKDPSGTDPLLDVLDRYFQVRCTLDRDRGYGAAAAGVQEAWHVYLSGRGITEASFTKGCEEKPWFLTFFPPEHKAESTCSLPLDQGCQTHFSSGSTFT